MPGTRWLDDDEQQVWRTLLEATQLLWDRLARELDDADEAGYPGLSLAEYEILVRLSEADGHRLRMSELAQQVVHTRSRLTHTISRMEKRGLVVRESCPEDGRGVFARMTDSGYDLLVETAPLHVEGVRRHVFDQLTDDEVKALGSAMTKIRTHLREH
jgi:DNA-binding MarR family transcriptional regulator